MSQLGLWAMSLVGNVDQRGFPESRIVPTPPCFTPGRGPTLPGPQKTTCGLLRIERGRHVLSVSVFPIVTVFPEGQVHLIHSRQTWLK